MNEKTKQSLDTAKAENGSLISKKDFVNVIKDVFSPKEPLPKSEPPCCSRTTANWTLKT